MKCSEILKKIEEFYPKSAALGFDNVGLLAGRFEKEVSCIYLALDATEEVIQAAHTNRADLLITHHPLIFSPMKHITDKDFIGKKVLSLIQNDISYYAMHTNYDVLRMSQIVADALQLKNTEVLDITGEFFGKEEGIGKIGDLPCSMTVKECCEFIKYHLNLTKVKVFGDMDKTVTRLAISPGSGKSAISSSLIKKADILVTGDIGHHEGLDAAEQGLNIIDAGHYGTEYFFIDDMETFLQNEFPEIHIIKSDIKHPFVVV